MPERSAARPPGWASDALIAVFVTVMQVQGVWVRGPATGERPLDDLAGLGFVLLVLPGLALLVRRRWPLLVLGISASASVVYFALDFSDGPAWLALFAALYSVTAYGDGRRSVVVAGVGIAALAVAWLVAARDIEPPEAVGWVVFRIGASVMSAALGESVRARREIAADAVVRAQLAERTREEEATARVAQERVRIARDVHDTVAHAISIINVQAGVTAHVLDKQPERARETLSTIEQTSAQALQELRAILGVLRSEEDPRAPVPGLAGIDPLLARARDAGLDIRLVEAPARPSTLPSTVTTAAYRIVQEALTNVVRHVGPTRVTVALEYGRDALEVLVEDQGCSDAGLAPARSAVSKGQPGRGIRGMQERCELLGGHLEAGPLPQAGFAVRARLPLGLAEGAR